MRCSNSSALQERELHLSAGVRNASRRQRDGGYLLLSIMLMMVMLVIALTVVAPSIVQQLKRDREEEMIHRGTEYARAIKKYYKKFGRYPANLEQLDNTNQVRFLRKHYKDPLTKDGKWKVLNYGDIQSLLNANGPGTPAAALGAAGQQGALGQALAQASQGNALSPGLTPGTAISQGAVVSGSGQQPTGTLGSSPGGATGNQPGNNPFANTFSLGGNSSQTDPSSSGQSGTALGQQSTSGSNQTFGGGAIVGVASTSKDPTIRIYNQKKTYDQWQFIYNPIMDQANVLLRGPYQPTTIGSTQIGTPAGQMNQQQSPFGQQTGSSGQPQQNVNPQSNPGTQFPPDQNHP